MAHLKPRFKSRFTTAFRHFFTSTEAERARDDAQDVPRPFIEHFIDLRDCIIRCSVAWVVAMVVVAPFSPWAIELLQAPLFASGLQEQGVSVEGLEVGVGFSLFMTTMLWGGTIVSLPILLYFIFRFVFPGLRRHERNIVLSTLIAGVVLFTGGVWLCFSFTLQLALEALMAINAWMNVPVTILQVEAYIGFVLKILLAFGLAFQFPLILLVLGWLGILSADTLKSRRGIAIILIFTVAMFLTPPDPLSQIIMAVPMCLLYELTILLVRLREKMSAEAEE
ncbi:MAG: twin-arginine translocase subunit TatC [Kiritimatiellae bacterium]|nr:twin-arginine translocase subunit TatC [Kiritimatiellia bacterium]